MQNSMKSEIKIQVGRANNGFVFNLPPSQILKIKKEAETANPLKELFLKFETKFNLLENAQELRKILPVLTGMSETQISHFTFEFSDPSNNQTSKI